MGRIGLELDEQGLLEDMEQVAVAFGDVLRARHLEGLGQRFVSDAIETREQLVECLAGGAEAPEVDGVRGDGSGGGCCGRLRRGFSCAAEHRRDGDGAEDLQESPSFEGLASRAGFAKILHGISHSSRKALPAITITEFGWHRTPIG